MNDEAVGAMTFAPETVLGESIYLWIAAMGSREQASFLTGLRQFLKNVGTGKALWLQQHQYPRLGRKQ